MRVKLNCLHAEYFKDNNCSLKSNQAWLVLIV